LVVVIAVVIVTIVVIVVIVRVGIHIIVNVYHLLLVMKTKGDKSRLRTI
jgi:hypothetical protein